MASPHAAAACAMLKSCDPSMSADEVMDALRSAAIDHGITGGGAGTLSMAALIGGFHPQPTPEPTPAPSLLMGDVNLDGSVDTADALIVLRYSMALIPLEGDALLAGDVNADSSVTAADALTILRMAMGLV